VEEVHVVGVNLPPEALEWCVGANLSCIARENSKDLKPCLDGSAAAQKSRNGFTLGYLVQPPRLLNVLPVTKPKLNTTWATEGQHYNSNLCPRSNRFDKFVCFLGNSPASIYQNTTDDPMHNSDDMRSTNRASGT
jgi:hypothetical protein